MTVSRSENELLAGTGGDEAEVAVPDLSVVTSALQVFGLSQIECRLYLTGLRLGARPASVFAKKMHLKRGQTYNLISNLVQKGVMGEFTRKGVRHFSSVPPEQLMVRLDRREREIAKEKEKLRSILPQLNSLRQSSLSLPKVRFLRGIEGIKDLYEEILRSATDEVLGLSDHEHSWAAAGEDTMEWLKDWVRRRAVKKVAYKGILNKSQLSKTLLRETQNSNRELKMLEGVKLPASIFVYNSSVAITTTGQEAIGVLIDSSAIAETLKSIHQELWKHLPDYWVDD